MKCLLKYLYSHRLPQNTLSPGRDADRVEGGCGKTAVRFSRTGQPQSRLPAQGIWSRKASDLRRRLSQQPHPPRRAHDIFAAPLKVS